MQLIHGLPLSTTMLTIGSISLATSAYAEAAEESRLCDIATFQVENDEAARTDRHYTGGLRVACVTSPPGPIGMLLRPRPSDGASTNERFTYSIGQSVFTPDNIDLEEVIDDDHPYAGWLYLGFGLESEVTFDHDRQRYLDMLELQLGVIGPPSGAAYLQRVTHDFLDATNPAGWGNQLDTEPGINLFFNRQWTGAVRADLAPDTGTPSLSFDVSPEIGWALGNIHIFSAGGLTFRFGSFPPNDPGVSSARPSLPGSDFFPARKGFSAYMFGGVEGRLVGRNIFLDGNSFQDDGPRVDKKSMVGEARLGFALAYDDLRLSYTHVFRSPEFEGQSRHIYGSLALALRL